LLVRTLCSGISGGTERLVYRGEVPAELALDDTLDVKVPDNTPRRLAQLGTAIARPFASIGEWITRRPWEAVRAAMQEELSGLSWTELFFGTAFLAAGTRAPETLGGVRE